MKAIHIQKTGGPEAMQLADLPVPTPKPTPAPPPAPKPKPGKPDNPLSWQFQAAMHGRAAVITGGRYAGPTAPMSIATRAPRDDDEDGDEED